MRAYRLRWDHARSGRTAATEATGHGCRRGNATRRPAHRRDVPNGRPERWRRRSAGATGCQASVHERPARHDQPAGKRRNATIPSSICRLTNTCRRFEGRCHHSGRAWCSDQWACPGLVQFHPSSRSLACRKECPHKCTNNLRRWQVHITKPSSLAERGVYEVVTMLTGWRTATTGQQQRPPGVVQQPQQQFAAPGGVNMMNPQQMQYYQMQQQYQQQQQQQNQHQPPTM